MVDVKIEELTVASTCSCNSDSAESACCSDTSASRTVLVLQKPVPNYTVNYSANCIGDTILFNNITDSATAYNWSFGDGSFSNAISPRHFYAAPGNYLP